MSLRTPVELNWLLKKRKSLESRIHVEEKRLADDLAALEKVQRLLRRENETTIQQLQVDLAAINHSLNLHEVVLAPRPTSPALRPQQFPRQCNYGALTSSIYLALAARAPEPVSTTAITSFVLANCRFEPPISDFQFLREKVRYRIKDLCRQGKLIRMNKSQRYAEGIWLAISSPRPTRSRGFPSDDEFPDDT
jgi:hypothetical protein